MTAFLQCHQWPPAREGVIQHGFSARVTCVSLLPSCGTAIMSARAPHLSCLRLLVSRRRLPSCRRIQNPCLPGCLHRSICPLLVSIRRPNQAGLSCCQHAAAKAMALAVKQAVQRRQPSNLMLTSNSHKQVDCSPKSASLFHKKWMSRVLATLRDELRILWTELRASS